MPQGPGRSSSRAPGVRARRRCCRCFPPASPNRWHRAARRRLPGHSASSNSPCRCARAAMSSGLRASLMSGWRRITPVAEHGASRRMRWNGLPSHHSPVALASAATRLACRPSRWRFSRTLTRRLSRGRRRPLRPVPAGFPAGGRSCRQAHSRRRGHAGRARFELGGQLRGFVLDADAALREAR